MRGYICHLTHEHILPLGIDTSFIFSTKTHCTKLFMKTCIRTHLPTFLWTHLSCCIRMQRSVCIWRHPASWVWILLTTRIQTILCKYIHGYIYPVGIEYIYLFSCSKKLVFNCICLGVPVIQEKTCFHLCTISLIWLYLITSTNLYMDTCFQL